MVTKKTVSKVLFIGLGIVGVITAYSLSLTAVSAIPAATIMGLIGILMLMQVGWVSLVNGEAEVQDIFSIVNLAIGGILILGSLALAGFQELPMFIEDIVPWAMGIGALAIGLFGVVKS